MDEVGTVPDKTGGSIHEANGCLIVPVEGTLDEDGLERLGAEILRRLEKTPVRGGDDQCFRSCAAELAWV